MLRILALLLLSAALLTPSPVAAQSTALPRLEPAACPPNIRLPADVQVTCRWLVVPERHEASEGPAIRLLYTHLRARTATPMPDPVIFPSSGGPGGPAIGSIFFMAEAFDFLATRDVILLEQRGTRYTEPALDCPELNAEQFANYGRAEPAADEIAREVAAAQACRASLQARGIDLDAYNSSQSANDLEALRRVLGIAQWNLIGSSYSARLIMTVMRLYPAGVRAVVLDSVYDPAVSYLEQRVPTFGRALERLFAACAAKPRCAAAYPDPAGDLRAVFAAADAAPIPLTVSHPRSGEPFTMQLSGADLAVGLYNAMRDPALLPYVPFVLHELRRGNVDPLTPLAQTGFNALFFNPLGMYYAVECHEEYPFADARLRKEAAAAYPALAGFLPTRADPAVCAAWPGARADAAFRAPLVSLIPALVFAGELDAVTAPELSRAAAERLPNAQFFAVRGLPHAVLDHSPCARALATDFIADPARTLDGACLAQHTAPTFVAPDAIAPTPAVYRLNRALFTPGDPAARAVGVVFGAGLLLQLGLAYAALVRRRVTPPVLSGGLAGLIGLICVGGLALAIRTSPPILLAFGLPAWAATLRWLPGAALAAALGALVVGYRPALVRRTDQLLIGLTVGLGSVLFGAALWSGLL
jgi:pimeloyl-ACP methyl ester carboxylesterase